METHGRYWSVLCLRRDARILSDSIPDLEGESKGFTKGME